MPKVKQRKIITKFTLKPDASVFKSVHIWQGTGTGSENGLISHVFLCFGSDTFFQHFWFQFKGNKITV